MLNDGTIIRTVRIKMFSCMPHGNIKTQSLINQGVNIFY